MKRWRTLMVLFPLVSALWLCAQLGSELTVRGCRRAEGDGVFGVAGRRTVCSLVVGRLEELVGDLLLLKADNYYHGQTSLLGRVRLHEGAHEHEGHHECHDHHHHHDGHGGEVEPADELDEVSPEHHGHCDGKGGLAYDHFFYRQYTKVASTAHEHLDASEELVPWLYASVRLNPGNERSAILTAYWLTEQLDRSDDAERILRAALAERPFSWRLRAELSWHHYRHGRFGPALRQCASALQLFKPDPDEEQARLDLARLWRLASACQEALGDIERALACAERVVTLVPASEAARHRVEVLRARLTHAPSATSADPDSAEPE